MADGPLASPAARRAYVLTKLAVLAAAGALTWPLARWIGPRAWWAFAVFAAALALVTAVVLAATRPRGEGSPPEDEDAPPSAPGEPIRIPVEDAIDLHPFAPREIPDVVRDYIDAAHAAGFREVRLIHGRGIGVQRERVRSVLAAHPLVEAFHDAPPARGGWGATIAHLRHDG